MKEWLGTGFPPNPMADHLFFSPTAPHSEDIWSRMDELNFSRASSAIKVVRVDDIQGDPLLMKIYPGMELDEVKEKAFALAYPENGKAPKYATSSHVYFGSSSIPLISFLFFGFFSFLFLFFSDFVF